MASLASALCVPLPSYLLRLSIVPFNIFICIALTTTPSAVRLCRSSSVLSLAFAQT